MDQRHDFRWRREVDTLHQLDYIVLGCDGNRSGGMNLEAWITPGVGSNLCRYSVDDANVINFHPELLRSDFSGTPVLYPTPNRVRDAVFRYQGQDYPQMLRGTPIYEHGLVHGEAWQHSEPQVRPESIALASWLDFVPGSDLYAAFPFHHRLSLKFTLTRTSLTATYSIDNKDTRAIPFGFGLHPYFSRLDGDDETCIEIPARFVMESTPDLLPTGKLIEVGGTRFDLRTPRPVGELDLDHVYTGIPEGQYAAVSYPRTGLRVRLVATQDFTHQVLYSPPGADYFCLENQTCSTDAHNLYERGFVSESGLKFVEPGNIHTGSVTYLVTKEK